MIKFDFWIASPSRLPFVDHDKQCCESCSGSFDKYNKAFCRRCKWSENTISTKEILEMRSGENAK